VTGSSRLGSEVNAESATSNQKAIFQTFTAVFQIVILSPLPGLDKFAASLQIRGSRDRNMAHAIG
jgi:hypothetical protein